MPPCSCKVNHAILVLNQHKCAYLSSFQWHHGAFVYVGTVHPQLWLQVVSAPVIGKVAQVGIERVVGTIIGGWTGYAVYMLGSKFWDETTDGEQRAFISRTDKQAHMLVGG